MIAVTVKSFWPKAKSLKSAKTICPCSLLMIDVFHVRQVLATMACDGLQSSPEKKCTPVPNLIKALQL